MTDKYLTFKKFNDPGLAAEIAQQLKTNNIDYLIEDNKPSFDISFAYNSFDYDICLKLKSRDFNKAHKVLDEFYKAQLNSVERNYYLFDFSDRELMEIISKRDEWGEFDYQLAQIILTERGKEIEPGIIEQLNYQRTKELSQPETANSYSIYRQYFSALLGGFPAIISGYNLFSSKKTMPDGQQVYSYGEKERKHGKRIFITGIICLVTWVIIILYLKSRQQLIYV